LLTPDGVYVDALVPSVREVWGHELTAEGLARGDHRPGETALEGLRRLLLGEGLDADAVDSGLSRWCRRFGELYVQLLEAASTEHWELAPGALEALRTLAADHDLALLTGNPEPVARVRMERLGLGELFPRGAGAFGCDAESRAELIAIARERAGGRRQSETVLVGDTPRDVEGARAAGVHVVGVTLGEFAADELRTADAVIGTLAELPGAVAAFER
jgi:phosphoglycolate phosphatase